jgi:hypothetical protein
MQYNTHDHCKVAKNKYILDIWVQGLQPRRIQEAYKIKDANAFILDSCLNVVTNGGYQFWDSQMEFVYHPY